MDSLELSRIERVVKLAIDIKSSVQAGSDLDGMAEDVLKQNLHKLIEVKADE